MKIIKILVVVTIIYICIIITNTYKKEIKIKENEFRGIYISYIDIKNSFYKKDIVEINKKTEEMINNIKEDNFNNIFIQVRPFSDSIYKSNIYPYSSIFNDIEDNFNYDFLQYFLKIAHSKNIKVHAWINPYRIRSTNNVSSISKKNPAYKWLNTNKVQISENGIYYNPGEKEVEDLIINGVKELIDNYEIDGIHYDDYFYPNSDININNYNEYIKENNITIKEYRYKIITKMIKRTYETIKNKDKNIIFSIAPDANNDNNLNKNYIDIKSIINNKYIDYIMPQIYYGFTNQYKPYIKTMLEWNNYINNDIKLIPVLAFYKINNYDKYAGSGSNEWLENKNIIKKQVLISRKFNKYHGFTIFRYDYFYSDKEYLKEERKSLLNILTIN